MLKERTTFSELTPTIVGKAIASILLVTEHEACDAGAESVAFGLAARWGLPIATVWPLVSNPEYEAVAPQNAARAEHEIAAKISNFRVAFEAAGVHTTVKVRRGDKWGQEIVEEAYSLGSELIILRQDPHRSSLFSLLFGETVANEVLCRGPSHVLVVPRDAHIWSNRILVAVEAFDLDCRTFVAAMGIALQWHLPLHLVVAIDDEIWRAESQAFVSAMQNHAEQSGIAVDGEVRLGEPAREILASMERTHSDLLIMGTCVKNHIPLPQVGGIIRKVLAASKHPVLVVRV